MGLFKQIAEPLITRGVPVMPLRPKTKIAFIENWPNYASTDPAIVQKWDEEYPDANGACVAFAKLDGIWFLEIDQQGFHEIIEQQTGQKIPPTFTVRSSPGRGHFYFRHTPKSLAMGNPQGKDSKGKETWSARTDNRYVVAPGSIHPGTGLPYETLRNVDIIPAPDWLVDWCVRNSGGPQTTGTISEDEQPIPEGSRNSTLASILGKARQNLNLSKEELYALGSSINQKRCHPPLPDSEIRTIANSIGGYAVVDAPPVIIGGKQAGQAQTIAPIEREPIKKVPYPVFPRWVMKGTSLYDGCVGPICEKNSRYPEFMFMPGVAMILNYIGTKVRIQRKNIIPSFFMVLIGQKGRVIKSSSVSDVAEYLGHAGLVSDANGSVRNAEGKSLIFTAGSAEGLGMEMARTNCKNAILYYDELSLLTSKAGIEGSSLLSNLLIIHESRKFSNNVKGRKETFGFEPGSYCASLIACTTDKNFHKQWSRMAGDSSGMDDRFFFLYQPEILNPLIPYEHVNTKEAALETRKRIDAAVARQSYYISDSTPLEMKMEKLGNRGESRAEKLALYFAVDLGRDEIDDECIGRAIAICEYEIAAKKFLSAFECTTREGSIQNEILQILQRNNGSILKRELERTIKPISYGTTAYNMAYYGLMKNGYIAEQGAGVKGDPSMVIMMRSMDTDDEN